jgi:hypothetical protein
MSDTAAPTPPAAPVAVPPPAPVATIVTQVPGAVSTGTASAATAAAIVTLIVWGLNYVHIAVPAEAAAAMGTLIGTGIHAAVMKWALGPLLNS